MPKMKISRLMFYSTVLTSVMLSSCSQHTQPHSTAENTTSNYVQNSATYWTEQPFCSGRYQINLPSNRISGTGWLKIQWLADKSATRLLESESRIRNRG